MLNCIPSMILCCLALAYSSVWFVASATTSSVHQAASFNGRVPEGFHHHRTPFSLSFYCARVPRSCSSSKRFQCREKASAVPNSRLRRARCRVAVRAAGGGALMDGRALKNVVVTGANRGLGFAIADHMLAIGGYRVVLACRNRQEGKAALERLRERREQQQRPNGTPSTVLPASVYPLDVTCPESLETFRQDCVDGHLGGRVDILFNNAGVCLVEGEDGGGGNGAEKEGAAAARVIRETLEVNFFGALGVMDVCLPALAAAAAAVAGASIPAVAEEDGVAAAAGEETMTPAPPPPTVVWVSSGEGELCFLGSKWRGLLGDAESLEEIKLHMSGFLNSVSAAERGGSGGGKPGQQTGGERRLLQEEEQEEIAFGPSPAYSLSKAAANAAVRAWAPRLLVPPPNPGAGRPSCGTSRGAARGVRLVAVCPGDVLTRMTSEEEMARGDAVSPEEAAVGVVKVAVGSAQDFPAGRFYRHGEEIGW